MKQQNYLYVVQGNYGYGWDDLTTCETLEEAQKDKRDYDLNENNPHRIVCRR